MASRDDFSQRVKETLAKRVGLRCSNPSCRRPTSGPHEDEARSVNIGVASHITAASPGGPRFDRSLSPIQRTEVGNGLWLCQNCASLIDRDTLRYTTEVLHRWKREAEFQADIELSGVVVSDYLPQPPAALHAPIPPIAGLTYHEARMRLINAGWQPDMRHWSHGSDANVQAGNGLEFWRRGYWEIINAWPTGLAQCTFPLRDVYGNNLVVMTVGEEDDANNWRARVSNWFFAKEESAARQIPTPSRISTPTNLLERVVPGTPTEQVRSWLGSPKSIHDDVLTYRYSDTQVQLTLGANGAVRQVVIALVNGQRYHGTGAPWGDYTLGEITLKDLQDMGHAIVLHSQSLRTEEVFVPVRVGPAGAYDDCTCGSLIVKTGIGALAPVSFLWDDQSESLQSDPAHTLINYISKPGGGQSPSFDYFIEG